MHTSRVLQSNHFTFAHRNAADGWQPATFDAFCPGWHPQDRIAVVAPVYEPAVLATGGVMLALATRFYDYQRSTGREFFNYPSHFAFMGSDAGRIVTSEGPMEADEATYSGPWSQLDTWPANRWHRTAPRMAAMLKLVFDLQIDRVFWPADFFDEPGEGDAKLIAHAAPMLRTHLKQVWLYGASEPTWRVNVDQGAAAMLQSSFQLVPTWSPQQARDHVTARTTGGNQPATFAEMPVDTFVERVSLAFCDR
jgi:hypothetical protein